MDFNIYDIYSDASINLDHKLGCAGVAVVNRKTDQIVKTMYLVKEQATNNMCEIMGIWLAIYIANTMRHTETLPFHINIFSDSQISLYGMREWLPNWIRKRQKDTDTLVSSTGLVANQEWFSDAYHMILMSGIKLKFWHQRGHIDTTNPNELFRCDRNFREANPHSLHMIGLKPMTISKYNNYVDETSRDIINEILAGVPIGTMAISNIYPAPQLPIGFHQYDEMYIEQYLKQINGGLNYPIKYTNGGMK